MIKVELGHLGVSFSCKLCCINPRGEGLEWFASSYVGDDEFLEASGKSPALAIEALRNKFHEEEK